ncbi:MAG TPA: leucyl aminopeptidase family protein [Burkholderiales bacterium]|nr:leucyl aminopeptidase family protein [Burkholderiales bacterium]
MAAVPFAPDMPGAPATRVVRVGRSLSTRDLARLDAVIVMGTAGKNTELKSQPFAPELRRSLARRRLETSAVRTVRLAGRRGTICLYGAAKPEASMFERLQLAGRLGRALEEFPARRLGVVTLATDSAQASRNLEALIAALWARAYRMPRFKGTPERGAEGQELRVFSQSTLNLDRLAAEARGNGLARWLTALPANVLTPASYRRLVAGLARKHGWRLKFLGRPALERLGAGAFLAVTQAHDAEGGIVHLRYRPRGATQAPVVALVGKGVCFDTGGVNLKPHRSMLDMHTDMGGSAVALAVLEALTTLRFPFAVDAWLALAENQIGPRAYKPQDVARAVNGTTIQVIHSDAEGRMLLADTLALAARERPRMILDFATLTGACVTALSERYAGIFTNRPALRAQFEAAGSASGERVWAFPMDDDFDSDIESRIADVAQCAVDARADHILAARFLKRFVPDEIAWAHVDLAPSERKGGLGHVTTDITGFGVRYALHLLLDSGILAGLR